MIVLQHEGLESVVGYNMLTDKFTTEIIDKGEATGFYLEGATIEELDSKFCEEVEYYLEQKNGK